MKVAVALLALTSVATAALAADEPVPRIVVGGNGTVTTPPDRVTIDFTLHGEGTTSDEAVRALVAKGKAIESGIARLAGPDPARGGEMAIGEVRGSGCTRNGYSSAARLSTGDCAIIGYTAEAQMEIRSANVKDGATIVGLIGRLGGVSPHIERYYLADDSAARTRALAAAMADARGQAEALASGAKVTLGRVLNISQSGYVRPTGDDIVVTAQRLSAPPPPPPPPPVEVSLTPQPIETHAQVQMVFAIGG